MRCFSDVFEKNIDVDVFDDVLQNAKHRANDASNDVNRPPLDAARSSAIKFNVKASIIAHFLLKLSPDLQRVTPCGLYC